MLTDELHPNSTLIDIPPAFHSSSTGKLFTSCVACGVQLFDEVLPYIIEKAYFRPNLSEKPKTMFEYSICNPCFEDYGAGFSDKSIARLEEFWDLHYKQEERLESFLIKDEINYLDWMERCCLLDLPRSELPMYQVNGLFIGKKMLLEECPWLVSGKAMDEMMQGYSKESKLRTLWFSKKYLNIPEEFQKYLPKV